MGYRSFYYGERRTGLPVHLLLDRAGRLDGYLATLLGVTEAVQPGPSRRPSGLELFDLVPVLQSNCRTALKSKSARTRGKPGRKEERATHDRYRPTR